MFSIIILLNLFAMFYTQNLQDIKKNINEAELEARYWADLAKIELLDAFHKKDIHHKAKNVIIFVGGGMGLSTITPSRILKGQLNNGTGEESYLSFEKFPNTCLLKTYAIDSQVPDSAATATALLSGVKTNNGVTGVNARVKKGLSNCESVQNNLITSIFDYAFEAGLSTGIVTNTRLTEATAAGGYASTADKEWEGHIPPKFAHHPTHEDCKDIGRQLIENHPGRNLNVILGGGGRFFFPKNYTDTFTGRPGRREDGLTLTNKWLDIKRDSGLPTESYTLVLNRDNLLNIKNNPKIKYMLGVFNEDHLSFEKERNNKLEPSLEEMVDSAINILNKNEHGFLLVVESGLIDLAHHENLANLALYETLAFDRAVSKAVNLVSNEETLIVVTADHSQALTMNGYQPRGSNIMGIAGQDDETHKGFTTLMYSNGPGYKKNRTDPTTVDITAPRYQSHSAIYLDSSHHTGEDVALYARGPMSHIFHGTKEQTYVSHAVQFAACIGEYIKFAHCIKDVLIDVNQLSSTSPHKMSISLYLIVIILLLLIKFNLFRA